MHSNCWGGMVYRLWHEQGLNSEYNLHNAHVHVPDVWRFTRSKNLEIVKQNKFVPNWVLRAASPFYQNTVLWVLQSTMKSLQ